MPVIDLVGWDTRQLGVRVGKLRDVSVYWPDGALADYELVVARVPQEKHDAIWELQSRGFRYVGLDLALEADPEALASAEDGPWTIRRLSRCVPDFRIEGFHINDSRLMLDPGCRQRLPDHFWDRMIHEHCSEFADTVICAVDEHENLRGIASCLVKIGNLDLKLVAVKDGSQGKGVGSALLRSAAALAREKHTTLTTSVMSTNIRGLKFYARNNFQLKGGEVVLHRWPKQ